MLSRFFSPFLLPAGFPILSLSGFPGGGGGLRGWPSNMGGGGGTNSGNISPGALTSVLPILGGGGGRIVAYMWKFPCLPSGGGTAAITRAPG